MIISFVRRAIVCAGIVALAISLVGQTAMAKNINNQNLSALGCTEEGDIAVFDGVQWVCESDLPAPPRFVDNGDGTVTDNDTGLMWEKKTGTASTPVICQDVTCPDPHELNNTYDWSGSGTGPDGSLFRDFLAPLILSDTDDPNQICFANYCDWRIPNILELQTILDCSLGSPCIITDG